MKRKATIIFTMFMVLFCSIAFSDTLFIPSGVEEIEAEAFYGDSSIDEIVLPEGIERIGEHAFAKGKFRKIFLPNSLNYIATNAFDGCTDLIATVGALSYAQQFCIDNKIPYVLPKTVLPAVSEVNVQKEDDARVCLQWNSVPSADGYAIFERSNGIEIFITKTSATKLNVPASTEGVHQYVVRTYFETGSIITFGHAISTEEIIVEENEYPALPQWTRVEEKTANNITFTWRGSAKNYTIIELLSDGTEKEITKSTSYTTTVSNISSGLHTYVIRANYADGKSATSYPWQIEVFGRAESITLNSIEIKLHYLETFQLSADILPSGTVQNRCVWSSKDDSIATVSSGLIKAVGGGTTVITAKIIGSELQESCIVTVVDDINIADDQFIVDHGVLSKYTGTESIVHIPKGVWKISKSAFSGHAEIEKITIPDTVTYIGDNAFKDCSNITEIDLPNSIEFLGQNAFYGCNGISSIVIPNSVLTMQQGVFASCKGLKSVIFSPGLLSIGSSSFAGCTGITRVDIPESITEIGAGAFSGCSGLTSINLKVGLVSIRSSAFSSCVNLETITIPNSVIELGKSAFYGCTNLSSISLSEGISAIGNNTFTNCVKLKTIAIPGSVAGIGEKAFQNCNSLSSISIENGVTFIGEYAFENCTSLTEIDLPNSVNSVDKYAFHSSGLQHFIAGNNLTTIEDYAFYECIDLQDIRIAGGRVNIGKYVCKDCSNLLLVDLGENAETIGESAFRECKALKKCYTGKALISIGDNAFYYCSALEDVNLPDTVREIGKYAFWWCESLSSIVIPEGITALPEFVFEGCHNLSNLSFPASLTSIGNYCFYDNDLSVFPASNTLTYIGYSAFGKNCFSVVNLPDSVVYIGDSCFSGCEQLKSISLPRYITKITGFRGCTSLESVSIPNSVLEIGDSAFLECSSLKDVSIPNSVTKIGKHAFAGCTSLTSLLIPESVTEIGTRAFALVYNGDHFVGGIYNIDLTLNIYGYIGSYAQEYATRNQYTERWGGLTFIPVTEYPGIIDLSVTKVTEPETMTILSPSIYLSEGETKPIDISMTPLRATIDSLTYDSSDHSIVVWDAQNKVLVGKKAGYATITISTYNGLKDTCKVTVIPSDCTEEQWLELLKRIEDEYEWMVFFNTFLRGGGVNPLGIKQDGIDLNSMVNSKIQSAYAKYLGYSAGTIESELTRGFTVFHGIMNQLSSKKSSDIYASIKLVKKALSYCKLSTDAYNAVLEALSATWWNNITGIEQFNYEAFENSFNAGCKAEIKALSNANFAAGSIKAIAQAIDLYVRYQGVDMDEAEIYVDALKNSSINSLQYAANILDNYINASEDDRLSVLMAYYGLLPTVEKAATSLIKQGMKLGVMELAKVLPVAGPVAISISTGITLGKAVNNLLLNIDDIQKAAFAAQYAINFCNSYLPYFQRTYTAFKDNPFDIQTYNVFVKAYSVYKELLGEAYEAFAELPKEFNKSIVSKLESLITGINHQESINSAEGFATLARTYMDYDLGAFGEIMYSGLKTINYLTH